MLQSSLNIIIIMQNMVKHKLHIKHTSQGNLYAYINENKHCKEMDLSQ